MAPSILLGQFYSVGRLGQIIGLGPEDIGLGAFDFGRFFVARNWGSALPGLRSYVLFVLPKKTSSSLGSETSEKKNSGNIYLKD